MLSGMACTSQVSDEVPPKSYRATPQSETEQVRDITVNSNVCANAHDTSIRSGKRCVRSSRREPDTAGSGEDTKHCWRHANKRPSEPRSPIVSDLPASESMTNPSSRTVRDPSPCLSSCSSFSGATTSAALSSRASLSSCRPSLRGSLGRKHRNRKSPDGLSRSFSRPAGVSCKSFKNTGFFQPPSDWDSDRRRYSERGARRSSCRDWNGQRDSSRKRQRPRDRSDGSNRQDGARTCGYKRSRSSSTERSRSGEVQCTRCLKWCRANREQKQITRTLPMEYWVRTAECKASKSEHISYIDKVAYSREQFIEETVFTCPFTGAQRDVLLEPNMFPYDVPTDIEHWTLWSRTELDDSEMEAFVAKWAAKNHPHAVEWECDNNEGDRSIDWYHVHVFFRLGCRDNSGARRDPTSAYTGPCGTAPRTNVENDACEVAQATAVEMRA